MVVPSTSATAHEGAGFTSKLMKELLSYLRIENFVISPYNHGSNKTERYIRTINDMICKYLTGSYMLTSCDPCSAQNNVTIRPLFYNSQV